jgi:hypothetical protein
MYHTIRNEGGMKCVSPTQRVSLIMHVSHSPAFRLLTPTTFFVLLSVNTLLHSHEARFLHDNDLPTCCNYFRGTVLSGLRRMKGRDIIFKSDCMNSYLLFHFNEKFSDFVFVHTNTNEDTP